jgi:putative ABC transport system permease protein
MSAGLIGWRPLARLAWRELTRRRLRTFLISLMIAVPMMLLTFGSVATRTQSIKGDRQRAVTLGPTVDVRLQDINNPSPTSPTLTLPPGASSTEVASWGGARIVSGKKRSFMQLNKAEWSAPLLGNQYLLRHGAWPTKPNEAAVSGALARKFGLKTGGTLSLALPKLTFTISGVYDIRDGLGYEEAALALGTDFPTLTKQGTEAFVDLGPKVPDVQVDSFVRGLDGWTPHHPSYQEWAPGVQPIRLGEGGPEPLVAMQVGFAVALFLIGLIVSAAFAVGARRQLRQLGLVAANGGDPRQVGRVITLQGTLTALLGSFAGIAMGLGLVALAAPHANFASSVVLPGLVIQPLDWLVAGITSLLAGTFAAGLAAREARRAPILAALAGRRPLPAVTFRFPVAGAALIALGLLTPLSFRSDSASSLILAVGAVSFLLGGVLCCTYLVGRLETLAGHWRGALRLAARRMARYRSRTGPLVSIVMATAAVAIAVSGFRLSDDASKERDHPPSMVANHVIVSGRGLADDEVASATSQVMKLLPGAKVATFPDLDYNGQATQIHYLRLPAPASASQQTYMRTFIGSEELLRVLNVSEAVIAKFRSGMAIVSSDSALTGSVPFELVTEKLQGPAGQETPAATTPATQPDQQVEKVTIDSVAWPNLNVGEFNVGNRCATCGGAPSGTVVILPSALASKLGMTATTSNRLIVTPQALTTRDRTALYQLTNELMQRGDDLAIENGKQDGSFVNVRFEPNPFWSSTWIVTLVTAGGLVLALVITVIALAMATVDNRADNATLTALGAGPDLSRKVRAWEGTLLSGMGVLLAVPLGMLPVLAVQSAKQYDYPIVFPFATVGILVIIVPALAWLIGYASARTPRRVADLNLQLD